MGIEMGKNQYCSECTKDMKWAAVDTETAAVDVPNHTRGQRTAAEIEQNHLRALKILQEKQRRRYTNPEKSLEKLDMRNAELCKELNELTIQCQPLHLNQYEHLLSDSSHEDQLCFLDLLE